MKWETKYNELLNTYTIDNENGKMICTIDGEGRTEEENKSIAQLIAAAPTLLSMIQNLLKWEKGTINYITVYKDAEELLKDINTI